MFLGEWSSLEKGNGGRDTMNGVKVANCDKSGT